MVTKYNTDAMKMRENQSQIPLQGPIQMDVWLEEGAITQNARRTISDGSAMLDKLTFNFQYDCDYDDNPKAPNFMTLPVADVNYTYANLQGRPIMSEVGNTAALGGGFPVLGHMIGYARGPAVIPASDGVSDTIAHRVAGPYMRLAPVTLYAYAYTGVLVEATTPIAIGDRLEMNEDTGYWNKNAGGTSGAIACHYSATAAGGTYVGALIVGPVTVVT